MLPLFLPANLEWAKRPGHRKALTLHSDSPGRQSSLVMIAYAVRENRLNG